MIFVECFKQWILLQSSAPEIWMEIDISNENARFNSSKNENTPIARHEEERVLFWVAAEYCYITPTQKHSFSRPDYIQIDL